MSCGHTATNLEYARQANETQPADFKEVRDKERKFVKRVTVMFDEVNKKLDRAAYCLDNLKTLASDAKGFPYITREKQQATRANVDCFFFEIISAKDLFLQGIYDASSMTSPRRHQVAERSLIRCLPDGNAKDVVSKIHELLDGRRLRREQKLRDDAYSWLWRLNNYRNSATHRELVHLGHEAQVTLPLGKELFNKIQQGRPVIKPILAGTRRKFRLR